MSQEIERQRQVIRRARKIAARYGRIGNETNAIRYLNALEERFPDGMSKETLHNQLREGWKKGNE